MKISFPALVVALGVSACGGQEAPPTADAPAESRTQPAFEPPVVTNENSPVKYPPALFQQNVEGVVMLRLFVDSAGRVRPESTRIAEASGIAGLDSAALAGVRDMRFVPARRNGRPVGTTFLQPVRFRRPERTGTPSEQ
jgi:protein TonB